MVRSSIALLLLAAVALSAGCSMVAPKYSPSLENVQKIKDANISPTKVGTFDFTAAAGNTNPISLRGSSLNSPYDGSYAKYIAEAVKQELVLAGKFAADAQLEVSGALQKNDINIPALGSGTGDLQARFVVKRGGEVRFDQVKMIHDEWDSSFVGAVAIPRAQERYPVMVQKLIGQLLADPAFLQSLK